MAQEHLLEVQLQLEEALGHLVRDQSAAHAFAPLLRQPRAMRPPVATPLGTSSNAGRFLVQEH